MLKWLGWKEKFYIDNSIKDPDKIRRAVDRKKPAPGVYLLTLSDTPGNILEIIPASLMLQKTLRRLCPPVLGMAKGKDSAMELAVMIIEEVYHNTGGFQIKEYMENR